MFSHLIHQSILTRPPPPIRTATPYSHPDAVQCEDILMEPDETTRIVHLLLWIFAVRSKDPTFTKTKYLYSLLHSPFLRGPAKEAFFQAFAKIHQHYSAFSRLSRLWRWRNAKIQIKMDLYMNDLEETHPHTFRILQRKSVYFFTLPNLANLITSAITHCMQFFHSPLPVKNPYNNVPFTKADLYNIYFAVRNNYIKVPFFFRRFFELDFDIYRFSLECECELRKTGIQQYVKTADSEILMEDIQEMLYAYDQEGRIKFSRGFPESTILRIFRPYLTNFLLSRFSFNLMEREYADRALKTDFAKFIFVNPLFGSRCALYPPLHTQYSFSDPTPWNEHYMESAIVGYPTPTTSSTPFLSNHVYEGDVAANISLHAFRGSFWDLIQPAVRNPARRPYSMPPPPPVAPLTIPVEEQEQEQDDIDSCSDDEEEVVHLEEDQLSEVSTYHSDSEEDDLDSLG